MIKWGRWLPGLSDDEQPEEESAVEKTLRTLGQGVSDVGAGISSGLSSAGDALGSAASTAGSYLPQLPSVLPEPVDPSRWAQPRRAEGQPSMLEQLPAVGAEYTRAATEALGDRGTLLAGMRPPETAEEVAAANAPAPFRAVRAASEVGSRAMEAGLGEYAERAAGTDPTFTTAEIPTPLGTIPSVTGPTPRQVGGAIGSVVGDPTSWILPGTAADRAASVAIEEGAGALRGQAGRAVGAAAEGVKGFLGRNAERVGAADARMAAEGSTVAPAGLGALPAPDPRRGVPTVEAISEQLDQARDAVRAAREAGDAEREQAAGEHMWALEDQMVDALNARRALEPRITSDIGRRVESLPLAEETADTLSGAGSRLERAAPGDLGVPMEAHRPSISLNAAFGMAPDAGGAAAARRADEIRASGGPASSVKKWDTLANAGVDTKEELADTLRTVPMVTAQQARALLGERPDYLEPVADFLLQQRKKALDGAMTARDVAKAYYMTLMSMRSSAQEAGALESKLGRGFVTGAGEAVPPNAQLGDLSGLVNPNNGKPLGDIFTEANPKHGGREVRPESAGAAWLWTDQGQRALNGVSEGEFIPEAWESGRHARLAFGSDTVGGNGALRPLTAAEIRAGKVNMTNLPQFVEELNAGIASMRRAGRESEIGPWLTDQAKRLNGISTGKSAFIKQLLGFGDSVTIDAREINYWLSGKGLLGKGDTSRGAQLARASGQWWDSDMVSGALQPRIQQEVMRLRNAYPELLEGIAPEDAAHILHHWIWDKAGGSATRHADVMTSQQLAASAGAVPATRGAGALPAVNRALSEGIAGGVGGAVIEQGRNPDEDPRTAAARGFVAGAVGFPLATRGARGLARLAGAAERGGGGALGTLGAITDNPLEAGRVFREGADGAALRRSGEPATAAAVPVDPGAARRARLAAQRAAPANGQIANLAGQAAAAPLTGPHTNGQHVTRNVARQIQKQAAAGVPPQVPTGPMPPPNPPPSWWDHAENWRYNLGLFAQLSTGMVQAAGGVVQALGGGAAEALRLGVLKGQPEALLPIAGEAIRSLPGGIKSAALTAAGQVPKAIQAGSDYKPPLHARELAQGNVGRGVGALAVAFPGQLTTQAPDALWHEMFYKTGIAQAAADEARRQAGGSPLAMGDRLRIQRDLIANPTPEILDEAKALAQNATYKGEAGRVLGAPKKITEALGPVGSFFMPIYNTIARIHEQALEYTPGLGLLPLDKLGLAPKGQARPVSRRIAQQAVGGALVLNGLSYAAAGGIRGPGPSNPNEAQGMRDQGYTPNTTNVGGYWIPNTWFGPWGPILNEIGAINDARLYDHGDTGWDDLTWEKKAAAIIKMSGRAAADYPALDTAQTVTKLFTAPEDALPSFLGEVAAQYVPGPLRTKAMAEDTKARTRTRGDDVPFAQRFEETVRQRSGWGREQLPVAQDILGRDVENPRQGWARALAPNIREEKPDPIIQAYLDAGLNIGDPATQLTMPGLKDTDLKPQLTPEETRRWNTLRGEAIIRRVEPMLADPAFAAQPLDARVKGLEKQRAAAAEEAHARLRSEIGAQEINRRISALHATKQRRQAS